MKVAFRLVICFLLTLTFEIGLCQSYYFTHYQTEHGLAHNSVTAIMQDSHDMLWIGTKAGLNRFDGRNFRFYKDPSNPYTALGNNNITALSEDKKGMIWIGTGRGLFNYDPYLEKVKAFPELTASHFSSVLVDENNDLWFLANNQLYRYDQKNDQLIEMKKPALCIAFDHQKNLWLGRKDGVIEKFDRKKKVFLSFQILDKKLPEDAKPISKLLAVDHDRLLIGTYKKGLKIFESGSAKTANLALHPPHNTETVIRDIVAYNDDEYWIGTETGIYIYHLRSGKASRLSKVAGDDYALSDDAVYAVCKDRQQSMWVGTYFGGLNYFSQENARFEKYYPLHNDKSIAGRAIKELVDDDCGNIWIGTEDGGLSKLNLVSSSIINYPSGPGRLLSGTNIQGMLFYDDRLYIGTYMKGLDVMNTRTTNIEIRYPLVGVANNNQSDFVTCMYRTKDNKILLGTLGKQIGLLSYDPVKKQFTRWGNLPFNSNITAIVEDHEGTIWVGTRDKGVYFISPRSGNEGYLKFQPNNVFPINGIFEDSYHCLWFTTDGGGLIQLYPDRKTTKVFMITNGLPSNITFRALEDDKQNLWISSLKGLISLNLLTKKIKIYTQANGLTTDQFNYNSALRTKDGKMYFGTIKGLISFNPETFLKQEISPYTYFTAIEINNKEVVPGDHNSPLKQSIVYTDSLLLKYDQSSFALEFATLDYTAPQATIYQYMMEGLDKSWISLTGNRKVYFTGLAPGEYRFVLKSVSNIGSWAGEERKLYIKISPPFWKTTTAYVCYFLSALSLMLIFAFFYRQNVERKNKSKFQLLQHEKEKEIYYAKIEFFTHITHEIQTPLTLIDGPMQVIMRSIEQYPGLKKNLLMINKNTSRLLELTTQLLDFRKTEVNGFRLNFVNTNVGEILLELINNFQREAEKLKVELTFIPSGEPVVAFVDKEAFIKISGNLISNAIKYASSFARVELQLHGADPADFAVRFVNDGVPIPPGYRTKVFEPFFRLPGNKKQGAGIGLALALSLSELHSGSLHVVSTAENTIFELFLPIHQKTEFKLGKWKGTLR